MAVPKSMIASNSMLVCSLRTIWSGDVFVDPSQRGAAIENFEINKFHQNIFFDELNVVDMVCWINSHKKRKQWHPCHNEPKPPFFC